MNFHLRSYPRYRKALRRLLFWRYWFRTKIQNDVYTFLASPDLYLDEDFIDNPKFLEVALKPPTRVTITMPFELETDVPDRSRAQGREE